MSSPAARRLTASHRDGQARIAGDVVISTLDAFNVLDVDDLDGSFPRFSRVMRPIVDGGRRRSATLAESYLRSFRALELGLGRGFNPVLAGPVDAARLATSLWVTGPVSLRSNLSRGMVREQAEEIARSRAAAAAARHAIAAGRETVAQAVEDDELAVGWSRVASANACDFCQELALGIVFKGDNADAIYAYHDGCACTIEPVYDEDL